MMNNLGSDPDLFQPVTFAAAVEVVANETGTPTGTVTFDISGTGGGTYTVPLNASGIAVLTTSTLEAGSHNVTAAYGGNDYCSASVGTYTTPIQ
jgi:hypothetical protein